MAELLEIREYLKGIYSRFDVYIEPVLKFVLSIVTLLLINLNIGYMSRLQNPALALIAALICSFMPVNVLVVIAALFCIAHAYALSLECAVVVFAVFMFMLLVYFRFSPSDALVVVLTPVCFAFKIPYVIPLSCGLVGTPLSAISACCGVVVYYVLGFIKTNEDAIMGLSDDSTVSKFRFLVDGLMNNKEMLVMLASFAVTVVLVWAIKRLSADHSWTVAMLSGFFTCAIMVLVGDMTMGVNISITGVILGGLVSLLIAVVLKFFVFSVDYTRTENLQFEDDEYYYYVKAVPKMAVAMPEKKVKHINQRRSAQDYPVFNQTRLDDMSDEPLRAGRTARPDAADERTSSRSSHYRQPLGDTYPGRPLQSRGSRQERSARTGSAARAGASRTGSNAAAGANASRARSAQSAGARTAQSVAASRTRAAGTPAGTPGASRGSAQIKTENRPAQPQRKPINYGRSSDRDRVIRRNSNDS